MSRIDQSLKANLILLVGTLLVLLGALLYPYYPGGSSIDPNLRNATAVFLIIYAVLIYLLGFKGFRNTIRITLLVTVCIELAIFSSITVNKRVPVPVEMFTKKAGYNDYTIDAIEHLNSIDKSFYRVMKDYQSALTIHKGWNDAKAQNYKGTSSYHSFNQQHYINFLGAVDLISGDDEK